MPSSLNWWIAMNFAFGAFLFIIASTLSLLPDLADVWSLDSRHVNAIYFAGSIPFTIAAYLQLFQAANAGEAIPGDGPSSPRRFVFGWQVGNIGWLSCALQFGGTILFNANTFDALLPSLNWFQQDLLIWVPNIVGSILFLISGYLAFIETCHGYWAWNPRSISWWVVFTNLLGCFGFLVSAILSLVVPGPMATDLLSRSIRCTLLGALGFFIGAMLMLAEGGGATEP